MPNDKVFTAEEFEELFAPGTEEGFTSEELDPLLPSRPIAGQLPDIERETVVEAEKGVQDMNVIEQLFEAGRRGDESFEIDLEGYEVALGKLPYEPVRDRKKQLEALPDIPLRGKGLLGRAATGAAQILPGMARGAAAGIPTALAAASATAIFGQAGPQALVPEEIITIPAAFQVGMTTGATLEFFKQGTGQFYMEMREEGIEHKTASIISQLAAGPYAAMELFQLGTLVPGIRQGLFNAVKGSAKIVAAKLAAKYGKNWAENVTQEIMQEAVGIASTEISKKVENSLKDKDLGPISLSKLSKRLIDTGIEAGLSFGLLQIPGAAVQTTKSIVEQKRKPTEEQPPTEEVPPETEIPPEPEEPVTEPGKEKEEPTPEPEPEPEPKKEEPKTEEAEKKEAEKPPTETALVPVTKEERRLVSSRKLGKIVREKAGELLTPKRKLLPAGVKEPLPTTEESGLPEGLELDDIKDVSGEFETFDDFKNSLSDNQIDPELLVNDVKRAGYADLESFYKEQRETFEATEFDPAEFDEAIGVEETEAEQKNIKQLQDLDKSIDEQFKGVEKSNTTNPKSILYNKILRIPEPEPGLKDDELIRIGQLRSRNIDFPEPKIIKSQKNVELLSEALFRAKAESQGLDPEGIIGPLSGLTEQGKRERLAESVKKATQILTAISDAITGKVKETEFEKVPGGRREQGKIDLGVEKEVPKGKIKTTEFDKEGTIFEETEGRGEQEGLFEPGEIKKGTKTERKRQLLNNQILNARNAKELNTLSKAIDTALRKKELARTDYLKLKQTLRERREVFGRPELEDIVRTRKIKLRESDYFRGKLREEMKDLVAKFGPGIINNKTGLPLDELASEAGMTEEQFRQALLASKPLEFRRGRGKKANVFEMEEGDLKDLFEETFGDIGQPAGIAFAVRKRFKNYDSFKKEIEDAWLKEDFERMKLAFAESTTADKVRYIKENRNATAKKKSWIVNFVSGVPVPGEFVKKKKIKAPAKKGLPPGLPPLPKKLEGTTFQKFDTMALVQLMRLFDRVPRINSRLRSALGRFIPVLNLVELRERLFWDTKLAEEVLGHEIGHFVDLAIEAIGQKKQFAERIMPLKKFIKGVREDIDLKKSLRKSVVELSKAWRGDFEKGDRYRDSAVELFADYMSAMFNSPGWVRQKWPDLHDTFNDLLNGKPAFREAYNLLTDWLTGKKLVDEWLDQQGKAVERTFDILLNPVKRMGENFRDFVKAKTISVFYRAFEKEGSPRVLGTSLFDELEVSHMKAGVWNELFYDTYQKRVQKELDVVSSEGMEAHKIFHSYAQATRTIDERRAAGKWIEKFPVVAREMLRQIIESDISLKNKYSNALANVDPSGLYDLSAVIFRDIHDRGELFVKRMSFLIDEIGIGPRGDAALMAFNVRGKLLNPGGLTVDRAKEVLNTLRGQLDNQQWRALERAAVALRFMLYRVQRQAYREGLISDNVWNEIIEPNRRNYFPYAVLDYFDGQLAAGVLPQKGTARDVADIILATQLKVASINGWRQRQNQVRLIRDMYNAGGISKAKIQTKPLKSSRDLLAIRDANKKDDVSRAVIWVDGKPRLIEFEDDPGKLLEQALENSALLWRAEYINKLGNITKSFMQLYTTWSMSFTFFRNPLRGARTAAQRVGFKNVAKVFTPEEIKTAFKISRNYADAAFGGTLLPEVRRLIKDEVILPPKFSTALVRDIDNAKDLIESGGILASHVKGLVDQKWPVWKGGKWGRNSFIQAEKLFAQYEAFEKIMTYHAALKRGFPAKKAIAIAQRGGIPKPGVGGSVSRYIEIPFPWTRVNIQGLRATHDVLRDPELNRGFITRFAITEALPRIIKYATGIGVVNLGILWLIRDDEDKKDPVMAEVMKRISPYKAAMDDTVPLLFYDPVTSQYHYFNEFKSGSEIPERFEVVSLRVPASEEGRLWGTLLYNMLISAPGAKEKLAPGGSDIWENLSNWTVNYFFPGVHPGIEWTGNMWDMVLRGENPEDSFTRAPAANTQLFNAGGKARAEAIAGYTLRQAGEMGEMAALIAMNMGILDPRAIDGLKRRQSGKIPIVERMPVIRNMLTYDNYKPWRDQAYAREQDKRIRAKAKLVMSNDVLELYSFYYRNLKNAKNLSGADRIRFNSASYFVNTLWGNLKNPYSYYSKSVAALDGSKQARETVRRDLDQIAAGTILRFRNAELAK